MAMITLLEREGLLVTVFSFAMQQQGRGYLWRKKAFPYTKILGEKFFKVLSTG